RRPAIEAPRVAVARLAAESALHIGAQGARERLRVAPRVGAPRQHQRVVTPARARALAVGQRAASPELVHAAAPRLADVVGPVGSDTELKQLAGVELAQRARR